MRPTIGRTISLQDVKMNNNLIIFLEDGTKKNLSFSIETHEQEALKRVEQLYGNLKIKKHFFLEHDKRQSEGVTADAYSVDERGALSFDERHNVIIEKTAAIKRKRDFLLKELDLAFMISLEKKCEECTEKIITLKNFLRDLPDNLRFDEITDLQDLKDYSPFNNIFGFIIFDGGEGYKNPPPIDIVPPCDAFFGFKAEAYAEVENGRITNIIIANPGCGYLRRPNVLVAPPNDENAKTKKQAIVKAELPQNMTESIHDIAKISNSALISEKPSSP
jgi:hypothetical protein